MLSRLASSSISVNPESESSDMAVTALDSYTTKRTNGKKTNGFQHTTVSSPYNAINLPFAKDTFDLVKQVNHALLYEAGIHLNGHSKGFQPPHFKNKELMSAYRNLQGGCKTLLGQHGKEIRDKVLQLDISDSLLCSTYHHALNEIFRDGINWGRIVAMFCFTIALAQRVYDEEKADTTIDSLISWQTAFIVEYLHDWIVQHQGWVSKYV